jgi:hypothetical protein
MTSTTAADPPEAPPLRPAGAALHDDLRAAGGDLERLQRLLADASGELIERFHAAAGELHAVLHATEGRPPPPQLQRAIEQVGGAITAMQFQDVASQLIAHACERLRGCADRLAREPGAEHAPGSSPGGAGGRPNPVEQRRMHAGSVELF